MFVQQSHYWLFACQIITITLGPHMLGHDLFLITVVVYMMMLGLPPVSHLLMRRSPQHGARLMRV